MKQPSSDQTPADIGVFISYSRTDLDFVRQLKVALAARGIQVSVDSEAIEKGEEWWPRIKQLITEADAIVFVLSPRAVTSPICLEELTVAASMHKRLLPIVADDLASAKVPETLSRLDYVFFNASDGNDAPGDFEHSVNQLVHALTTDIAWVREHTRLGVLANRWHERGRPRALLLRGTELTAAEVWLMAPPQQSPDPTNLHRQFILNSRQSSARRRRYAIGITTVIALLIVGLAILSFQERTKALRALSAGLLAKAEEYVQNRRRPEAITLAAEALQKDPQNLPAYATVFEGLAKLHYGLRYTREWCDEEEFLAVSYHGDSIATVLRRNASTSFRITIEQTSTGSTKQLDVDDYPGQAVFAKDSNHLFLVGDQIVIVDLARDVIRARVPAKTYKFSHLKILHDSDSDSFWTVDYSGLHRFDMNALAYVETLPLDQHLSVSGFSRSLPTHVARHRSINYLAIGVPGQSEGYTGEADDTGRVFIIDGAARRPVAFIHSGLVSDLTFVGTDEGGSAGLLCIAKPGGTVELWSIPDSIQGSNSGDELLQLEKKEVLIERRETDFYVQGPDPNLSAKTQILQIGPYLGVFTSGRLSLIELKSRRLVDSGVFDERIIAYYSDTFIVAGLASAFATISQNEIAEPRTHCSRLRVWSAGVPQFEVIELREDFQRVFQEREQSEYIFKDLGFTGDWKVENTGAYETRIAYLSKEAHTRHATRFVLNLIDVGKNGSRLVASHPVPDEACADRPALYATSAEVCSLCKGEDDRPGGSCARWDGGSMVRPLSLSEADAIVDSPARRLTTTEFSISRIVESIGGDRIETTPDGSTVLFRKSHAPVVWRGTGILCEPVEQIRAKTIALTGLRVRAGLGVEVNATRYRKK